MRRTEQRQGLRMMKLHDVLSRWEAASLSQLEAAEILGMSERTFRRWTKRYEEHGEEGLIDRRLRSKPERSPSPAERARVEGLYRERYGGFTAKHFHEVLVRHHGFNWGYTWTKGFLQGRGLVAKAPRRGAHRRKRPRRPLEGMMIHQDGSRHAWLEGHGPLDLIATMDDATSEITSLFLVAEEGTHSSFRGLAETFERKGLPCALYTDRGSHYFHTPEAGGKVDKDAPTQVGRALAQLGIEHIPAYSPEARGRSERMFRTLQDRLVKELKLAGVCDIAAANAWIAGTFLPAHNARFQVTAAEAGSAWVACEAHHWRDILALQETRQVAPDNTVRWKGRILQIPQGSSRAHYVRANVRLHEYPDGTIALFHGPRRIASFEPETEEPDAAQTRSEPESPAAGRRRASGGAKTLHRPATPASAKATRKKAMTA